ncbi:unnamed protein product, partial [Durusdinium trenchii]
GLQWEWAHALLSRVTSWTLRRDALSASVALSSLNQARWHSALDGLAQETSRGLETAIARNAVLGILADRALWRSTVQILAGFPKRQLQLDLASLGASVTAGALSSAWESSLQLQRLMKCLRVFADALCYKAAATAAGHGRLWRGALNQLGGERLPESEAEV